MSKFSGRVRLTAALAVLVGLTVPLAAQQEPPVKMSKSGICHDRNSPYYSRTKNFRPFKTMQACLDAGGRRPKN